MRRSLVSASAGLVLSALASAAMASSSPDGDGDICVVDDTERELCLAAPAERIVALSPSVTEMLFAAGPASGWWG